MLVLKILTTALACVLAVVELQAGDWPFVNGPTFDAHTSGEHLYEDWPDGGPQVLWSKPLGQGYSAVTVVGDRCLTQYQSVFGQYVICFNATTGETLWEHRYDAPFEALGIYPGPRSTPTISGDRVYFVSPDAVVGCLALETGKSIWTVHANREFQGKGTEFGYSASPLVIENLVVLPIGGPGSSVVALSAETGQLVWKTGDDTASYCPTIPIQFEGETLLVSYLENVLVIHDLNGQQLFRTELTNGYDEHAAMPVYQEPLLVLSAPFKAGATAYRLSWEEQSDRGRSLRLTHVWHNPQFSKDVTTSAAIGNLLIGFDLKDPQSKAHRPSRGTFRGLDMRTGEVVWSNNEIGQANVIVAGEQLMLFNDRGEILLAKIEADQCQVRSKVMVYPKQVCWTRPTLSDGRLFVRTHDQAVCLLVGDRTQQQITSPTPIRLQDLAHQTSFELNWLLSGEREHPFMLPAWDELRLWFLSGLALYLSVLPVDLLLRNWSRTSQRPVERRVIELLLLVCLGLIATQLLNHGSQAFWFTWPVALSAALQLAICASHQASLNRTNRQRHHLARMTGLAFLLLCGGYYVVLQQLSEPHLWVFLIGLAPAAPLAIWAETALSRKSSWLRISMFSLMVYTTLFWAAVAFQSWR